MKNYVRPTVEVEVYQYEGVLCSSTAEDPRQIADFELLAEQEW